MRHGNLQNAIAEAMTDYLETGEFRPHNPAILRDGAGYRYGSSMNAGADEVVMLDLAEGFGTWEPEEADQVEDCALGLTGEILNIG